MATRVIPRIEVDAPHDAAKSTVASAYLRALAALPEESKAPRAWVIAVSDYETLVAPHHGSLHRGRMISASAATAGHYEPHGAIEQITSKPRLPERQRPSELVSATPSRPILAASEWTLGSVAQCVAISDWLRTSVGPLAGEGHGGARERATCLLSDLSDDAVRLGIARETWQFVRRVVEHEVAQVVTRLVHWSCSLVPATEPGQEELIAVDVVLGTSAPDDVELQNRMQDAVRSTLAEGTNHLVVVTLLYRD